jgi:uncharacterized membrane protein YcjF (UPF0283 family)
MANTVINVTITIQQANAAQLLAAFQVNDPINAGETTSDYVKRIIQQVLNDRARQVLSQQAASAAAMAVASPGITAT